MGLGSLVDALKVAVSEALAGTACPQFINEILCNVILQSMSYVIKMLGFVFGVTLVFGRTKDTFIRVTKVVLLVCGVFWLLSYSGSGSKCSAAECKGCMPQNAAQNMGEMWEVVR